MKMLSRPPHLPTTSGIHPSGISLKSSLIELFVTMPKNQTVMKGTRSLSVS